MNALISKQRLQVTDGFFSKSFYLYTVRKKFSWGTKYVYRGTFSFIFYFFSTCHGKVILELKQAMFNLATSFHMKSRKLSGRQKKMKQNKNENIEWEHNQISKARLNSCYFRKYKSMKIQHQQVLWTKRQQFA